MKTKVLRKKAEVKQTKTDVICPLGYKKNPSTNSIEIDEVKAPKIRILFNMLAKEPPSDAVLINVINTFFKGGFLEVYSTIQNPFYCGFFERNGYLYKGIHTPLVNILTWENANENLAKILNRLLKPIVFYRQKLIEFSKYIEEGARNSKG
ncbi:MAG: hypothetical protein IKO48_01985 [Elusimicrobia bacterium]|nr:hypothetical protein [Elusimicrobiota bacterium]